MWAFEIDAPRDSALQEGIAAFSEFRKIGETFSYLGRLCIVTGHFEVWDMGCLVPMLLCDYVDKNGVIRQAKFPLRALPGLIKQQGG